MDEVVGEEEELEGKEVEDGGKEGKEGAADGGGHGSGALGLWWHGEGWGVKRIKGN